MSDLRIKKYRAAIEVLQRGREQLIERMADEILEQQESLLEAGFQFNEFLESHGTRLHFLDLMVVHMEQSAEDLEDTAVEAMKVDPGLSRPDHSSNRPRSRGRARHVRPRRPSRPDAEESVDETPF
jgi:hypothetical protein